jgi:hypothetical protein
VELSQPTYCSLSVRFVGGWFARGRPKGGRLARAGGSSQQALRSRAKARVPSTSSAPTLQCSQKKCSRPQRHQPRSAAWMESLLLLVQRRAPSASSPPVGGPFSRPTCLFPSWCRLQAGWLATLWNLSTRVEARCLDKCVEIVLMFVGWCVYLAVTCGATHLQRVP